jgi:hypothetical protein
VPSPWPRWILDSHAALVGAPLIDVPPGADPAAALFDAPLVVLAHDGDPGPDGPRLVYGNRAALDLWELPWERFVGMPSRRTAEPDVQAERERLLDDARRKGWTDGYTGVRISASGRRFEIVDARLWTVRDDDGRVVGQAAAFATWRPVEPAG